MDSPKALDLKRPIKEADMSVPIPQQQFEFSATIQMTDLPSKEIAFYSIILSVTTRAEWQRLPHYWLGEITMTIGWSLSASSSDRALVKVCTGSTPMVGS
jgi:hypothetical protein